MRYIRVASVMALAVISTGLPGCAKGKHPFRMVQFCLNGANEIPAFVKFMRAIADKHGMQFYDRSSDTHAELQSLSRDNENVPVNQRAVNIGAQRGSEFSFGAGNLGMPTDQIVIGFNGADLEASKSFANSAVSSLSNRWHVREVAAGKGAFPLSRCD